ncbi:MAG: nucleotidyltransferase family protein [Pseudomonadota bacterium]
MASGADKPFSRAMVLAAGLGQRMRPLTNDRPKPMIRVAGRPLIDYALDRLAQGGVAEAIVNVHYFADMLEAHLADRRAAPRIVISDERERLLDTGGGLLKAAPLLGDAPVFYCNTDAILVDGRVDPLRAMQAAWRDDAMDALLLVAPLRIASGYGGAGDFDLDADGRLVRRGTRPAAPYVWTGVQIMHPRLLKDAPPGAFSTNLLWDKAIAAGRAFGLIHDGLWMHVGSPDGLEEAERRLDQLKRRCA